MDMDLALTFGTQQIHTSERMRKHPGMARIFRSLFGYTNLGNYARFSIFKRLVQAIELPEDPKILDLGAGYGEYSFSLANALPEARITALDIDKKRVRTLQHAIDSSETQNIRPFHGYLEELYEGEFDFIYSIDVFEHIKPEEMPFTAARIRLNPGGYLMVKMPSKKQLTILPEAWFEDHQEWLEDEHIGQVYELEDLKARFEKEGFEVVEAFYSDGWWSRLGWELAYLGKKAGVITQLLSLPIAKVMVWIDRLVHTGKSGNAIQVIAKKR